MNGKRKKKRVPKEVAPIRVIDSISKNISTILLEMGIYPGTEDFDEMYLCLINTLSEEIKSNVIKIIRDIIDE